MTNSKRMIVTSALPYANGEIHIGHLVEYLQTDFWVRFQRMRGSDCVYVCADDTHGTPVMIRARRESITPEDLIERSHARHSKDFEDFEIQFDEYYTTHSPENRELCHRIFARMQSGGHIDVRSIPQLYCPNDAMFLPDRFVRGGCPLCSAKEQYGDGCEICGANYAVAELQSPTCALCGAVPEIRSSEHLFFNVNNFKPYLAEWIPTHTASDVSNKLLEWFGDDLRPWDISRDAPYFGFAIPGYPEKYFYVWMDAPIGYMAALTRWCRRHNLDFDHVWNETSTSIYHFIGKDIVRFHCLFWPAMLRCADLQGPSAVFVHGFLTVNGEKMSKSRGTFISARTFLDYLPAQSLRYYYACKMNGTTDDIDLNLEDFVSRVNADLVGKITNLASRGAQMLHKSLEGRLGRLDDGGRALLATVHAEVETLAIHYDARDFSKAMVCIRAAAETANRYFDARMPWSLVKTDPEAARTVLTAVLNVFRTLAIVLSPILPEYARKSARLFGDAPSLSYDWEDARTVLEDQKLDPYEYLAERIDPRQVAKMVEASK